MHSPFFVCRSTYLSEKVNKQFGQTYVLRVAQIERVLFRCLERALDITSLHLASVTTTACLC